MMEPELKKQLHDIHESIIYLHKWRWWKAGLDGILRGAGSVVGVALALVLIGWILNIVGVIPAFRQEVDQWRAILQSTQRQLPSGSVDRGN